MIIRYLKSIFLLAIILLSACSTKKNTSMTRAYHNLTSYYNVYYNGKEAYNSGLRKIEKSYQEDYSLLLPIFKFNNAEATRSAYADMNRAIEKGSKCIQKHSITVKPKKKRQGNSRKDREFYNQPEYVKWIDDAYLLIGKSNFIKHDVYPAIENFNYIVKEYSKDPIKYEAYVWLARTYVLMENYAKAQEFLDLIDAERSKVSVSVLGGMYSTQADLNIKTEKFSEAIVALEESIERTNDKKTKVRFTYILAQLYAKVKDNRKAFELFGEVINKNPSYDMVFNAQINRAAIFNSSTGSSEELQKELHKMLKDDKNIDYQDQIYYALGKIAANQEKLVDAINYYKLSVATSTQNQNQKGVSYLSIADIYFEEPDYAYSQAYYDSAVVLLSNNYPNYIEIKGKSENLNVLVKYLNVIQLEDSLQRVAGMNDADRVALIDGLIANEVAREVAAQEAKAQQQQDLSLMQQQSRTVTQQQGTAWYFYNPTMLSIGLSEFKQKWGDRKNEDNWRRSNKAVLEFDEISTVDGAESEVEKVELSPKTREYYLVNLPIGDSAMEVSNKRIEEAYYNVAVVYKDKFNDLSLSSEAYENLLISFPGTSFTLPAYYDLYKVYTLSKDFEKAEKYKQKIINEFPNSDNAKVLSNPNYFKELQAIEDRVEFLYQATYKYFLVDNCEEVVNTYHYVDTAYNQSKLLPKFALLATLCSGKGADTLVFKESLQNFIGMYPQSNEATYANDVLSALDKKPKEPEAEEEVEEEVFGEDLATEESLEELDISMFTLNEEAAYYYMVIVDNEKVEGNRIKFNLNNFNLDYYSFLEFEVENLLLSAKYASILVKKFKNKQMASNYFESVIIAGEVFENIISDAYKMYIISEENFKAFYDDKNVLRYQKFFEENYPQLK